MVTLGTLATKLGWSLFNFVTGKGFSKAYSRLKQTEYQKYSDCLNPPLKSAIKNTCEIFLDTENTPYLINPEILKNIYKMDDIKLNFLFSRENMSIDHFTTEDCFEFIRDSLKLYIKREYEDEIAEEFYDLWIQKLSEIYKQKFGEFCTSDDIFFRSFAFDVLEMSLNEYSVFKTVLINALSGINEINNTVKDIKSDTEVIKEMMVEFCSERKTLKPQEAFLSEIEETTFEDNENIKTIKMFIEKYHYQCNAFS